MATAPSRPYMPSEVADEMARWNNHDLSPAFRQYRQPIDALMSQMVAGVVERYVPPSASPPSFLEVCCGTGQLGQWLPPWFAAKTLHVDYSGPAIEQLRRERPAANASIADVRSLPFADGQFSAVVGLCALDSLPQQREARNEIRRVLAPGGVLIHWLDTQSGPEALFSHLVQRGEIPLPNFLDASNLAQVRPQMRSRLPQTKMLDDYLAVPHLALSRLVDFLQRCNSPDAAEIAPFVQRFTPGNFNPNETTEQFMSLVSDPQLIERMNQRLLSLWLQFGLGQHEEVPALALRPISTVRYVQQRLEALFSPSEGFATELSEIVSLRTMRMNEGHLPPHLKFHLRCVGRTLSLDKVPPQLVGVPLGQITQRPSDAQPPTTTAVDGELVLEAGALVFVARRLPAEV